MPAPIAFGIYLPTGPAMRPLPPVTPPGLMPTGSITDPDGTIWDPIWFQDYLEPVAEGGFVPVTSGSDLGVLDPNSAGGKVYGYGGSSVGGAFKVKAAMSSTGEANTYYDAASTTSVASSIFRVREQALSDGTFRGGAMKPYFIGQQATVSGSLRIIHKTRCSGYGGGAWDWIGTNTDWQAGGGEFGCPEHGNNSTRGYADYRAKAASSAAYSRVDYYFSTMQIGNWHIWDSAWVAGQFVRASVDGVQFMNDTVTPWTTDKGWLLQCGWPQGGTPGQQGLIECDWVVAYQKRMTATTYGSAQYGTGKYGA